MVSIKRIFFAISNPDVFFSEKTLVDCVDFLNNNRQFSIAFDPECDSAGQPDQAALDLIEDMIY